LSGFAGASRLLLFIGRWTGLAGVLVCAVFWTMFTYGHLTAPGWDGASGMTFVISALMIGLALAGAWASIKYAPVVLLAVFAVSFFPVGFYIMMTPGAWWIGAGNFLYLVAALLVIVGRLGSYGCRAASV
jgi:hypothetical protein